MVSGASHALLGVSFEPEIAQPAISGRLSPIHGQSLITLGVTLSHTSLAVLTVLRPTTVWRSSLFTTA